MTSKVLAILFALTFSLQAGIRVGESPTGALPVELTSFSATVLDVEIIVNKILYDNKVIQLCGACSHKIYNKQIGDKS